MPFKNAECLRVKCERAPVLDNQRARVSKDPLTSLSQMKTKNPMGVLSANLAAMSSSFAEDGVTPIIGNLGIRPRKIRLHKHDTNDCFLRINPGLIQLFRD